MARAAPEMLANMERSVAALGISSTSDLLALPDAPALDQEEIVLRGARPSGAASATHGPDPRSPVWLRLRRAERDAKLAELGATEWTSKKIERVALLRANVPCCDAPSCARSRTVITAEIELEGGERVVVAEDRLFEGESGSATRIARSLAEMTGAPLAGEVGDEQAEGGGEAEASIQGEPAIDARALSRFALHSEGDRIVLRDHAGAGPRASARRNGLIGAVLLALALVAWVQVARSMMAGSTGVVLAFASTAALLSLAGYAFAGVARFSAKYTATSNPAVALGRDRIIVAPWVSRTGAIELRADGRLGAAIPIAEVRGVSARARENDGFAVEVDTDHGPIDAIVCDSEDVAAYWARALDRAIASIRHPGAGASARQRARERAKKPAPR